MVKGPLGGHADTVTVREEVDWVVQVVGKPALVRQFSFSAVQTTERVKEVGHRLRELTRARAGPEADGTRNHAT